MSKAGIDISRYVTHSCRAAASSFAQAKKVPLKKIMESCGWSAEATFANHYSKEVGDDRTIGEELLRMCEFELLNMDISRTIELFCMLMYAICVFVTMVSDFYLLLIQ